MITLTFSWAPDGLTFTLSAFSWEDTNFDQIKSRKGVLFVRLEPYFRTQEDCCVACFWLKVHIALSPVSRMYWRGSCIFMGDVDVQ